MDIKRSKGIALYHQLEKILVNLINNDHLKENDKLPSERELCENYNVSRTTARQAVAELERKGYIYKVHGKGIFVSPKVYKQQLLKFYSFTEEMKKLNKVPSSKILSFDLINADEIIANKLKLNDNLKVYKITRLRLAENEPMMVEITYLPEGRFKNLSENLLKEAPMYDVFREKYHINITKAIESFKPVLINKVEALQLEIKEAMAAMKIERITFENLEVVEYTTSTARGDKFEYTVSLE